MGAALIYTSKYCHRAIRRMFPNIRGLDSCAVLAASRKVNSERMLMMYQECVIKLSMANRGSRLAGWVIGPSRMD